MLDQAPSQIRLRTAELDLVFRDAALDDLVPLLEAIEESLPQFKQFMIWSHMPQTPEFQRARLEQMKEPSWRANNRIYHILSPDEGRFLGCIGLHAGRVINPKGFEIGFWVRSSEAGRGIITAATRAMVVLGFEKLGAERIQCGYNEANHASARVSQKVGFRKEARLRNFEPTPSAAQRADGCLAANAMLLGALFPDDRDHLAWYAQTRDQLTFGGNEKGASALSSS
jgi:RimJ/RimL family protein N-acetyltransferase